MKVIHAIESIALMMVPFAISIVYIPSLVKAIVKAIKDNARETAERIEQMMEEAKAQLEEDKK